MILQALASYYDRLVQQASGGFPVVGFQKKEIPFVIVLDKDGHFKGLHDTREGVGKNKRAPERIVPHEEKRTGKNAWMVANMLWDNESYVLGFSKDDPAKASKQHQSFVSRIKAVFPDPSIDEGISAAVKFLDKGDFSGVFEHSAWSDIEKKGGNITFQLEGDTQLICQRPAIAHAIAAVNPKDAERTQSCLVTGEPDEPVRLHTAIKGIWGAQSSGANIVSFNLDAFNSYGKKQGYNAPVGKKAEFAYTTALNNLLAKGSHQRIQVGDASTVFWAARETPMEKWFTDFFGEPAKGEAIQDNEAIRALYNAPQTGTPPLEEDLTPFYVLGMAPNASRIAVRFWYDGTVGEVAKRVRQHFDDTVIVHGPGQPDHLSLFRLLVSTAIGGESKHIQPELAGDVMKAILKGTPYPQTLLASVLSRIKAEQSKKDTNGKSLQNVTYARASLIKAKLARDARYYRQKEKEVGMSLDTTNVNPGYLLGRLFAVLEKAQEEASPNINATIRDHFYGAASSTPVTVFPSLMKLKNHHLAKLENRGRAVNLEKQIGEIMGGFADFPVHLSLSDQGRFAIGYYHQRQALFTKKDDKGAKSS